MIRTTDDGNLQVVTIDRPARRNALRSTDLDALEAAATGAGAPVIFPRGSGPAFCTDADLDSATDFDDPEAFVEYGQHAADAVESAESIVTTGIDGTVRGDGVELALACNVRVATSRMTLGELGARLGLSGAWGGMVRLPCVIGEGHALEFSLSSRVVNADEAPRMGLVSRVVDDLGEVTASVAGNDHRPLRIAKERLRDRDDWDGRLEREVAGFMELYRANVDGTAASREK